MRCCQGLTNARSPLTKETPVKGSWTTLADRHVPARRRRRRFTRTRRTPWDGRCSPNTPGSRCARPGPARAAASSQFEGQSILSQHSERRRASSPTRRSVPGRDERMHPKGKPFESSPLGMVTIGPPRTVQGAMYFGSPVVSRPSVAGPGAAGQKKASDVSKAAKTQRATDPALPYRPGIVASGSTVLRRELYAKAVRPSFRRGPGRWASARPASYIKLFQCSTSMRSKGNGDGRSSTA